MAGFPPVPPPYGPDPGQQRRFAREQAKQYARSQKAVYQAQRHLQRQQNRALRRNSFLGPVLVLGFGIVALLISSGRLAVGSFRTWFAHWWPLLVVAAGVLLLFEWFLDEKTGADGAPYVRRRIGGGTVALLILLMLCGLSFATVDHFHITDGFNLNSENLEEFFGDKYDREQQIDQAFPAGTSLSVDNPRGDVTITGKSDDDQIHITVNKQIYSRSQADANSKAEDFSPRLELVGSTLSLVVPQRDGASADLTITLPESGQTTVSADHGDIRITGLHAAVNVTANHGDVDVNAITGPVNAHISSSHSSFSAHTVTGDVLVKGRADNLSVTDVSGLVALEGEFYGDTHLERLHGPVTFNTDRTHFTLARLDGEIDVSPDSDLTGSDIAGPVELHTRSRNITLERVSGPVDIANSNGSVDLDHALPMGNVSIDNKNGEVTLTVPDRSGMTIDAETRGASVENDFALQTVTDRDRATLHGSTGDGANRITIRASHADIAIHKSNPPPLQASPAPPAAAIQKPAR